MRTSAMAPTHSHGPARRNRDRDHRRRRGQALAVSLVGVLVATEAGVRGADNALCTVLGLEFGADLHLPRRGMAQTSAAARPVTAAAVAVSRAVQIVVMSWSRRAITSPRCRRARGRR
jgi:hypothetical protein